VMSIENVMVWRREIERVLMSERGSRSEVTVSWKDGQWRLLIRWENGEEVEWGARRISSMVDDPMKGEDDVKGPSWVLLRSLD
jgi:hypothetical protein